MKKIIFTLVTICFAILNVCGQSTWREHPESVNIGKQLRNGFFTRHYNHEIEIDKNFIFVVDNRTLVLNLKCPSRALEYRGEVKVETFYDIEAILSHRPNESRWFLPGEAVQVSFDLTPLSKNQEYNIEFKFHTDKDEIYFIDLYLIKDPLDPERFITVTDPASYFETLQEDENYVYNWVEYHTEFPGGNEGLVRFLKENIRLENLPPQKDDTSYLNDCNSACIGMIIDKDGSILYPELLSGDNPVFNEETERLVSIMPKWKPATIDGIKVKQRVMVHIFFYKLEISCFMFEDLLLKVTSSID